MNSNSRREEKNSELTTHVSLILHDPAELKYSARNFGNQSEIFKSSEEICRDDITMRRKIALGEDKSMNRSPERPLSRNSNASGTSSSPSPSGEYGTADSTATVASGQGRSEVQSLSSFSEPRKKKTRTVFSRSQIFQLESTFDMKRYLSSSERANLAASLHLTETQVGRLQCYYTYFYACFRLIIIFFSFLLSLLFILLFIFLPINWQWRNIHGISNYFQYVLTLKKIKYLFCLFNPFATNSRPLFFHYFASPKLFYVAMTQYYVILPCAEKYH